jgi:hypothetical protein
MGIIRIVVRLMSFALKKKNLIKFVELLIRSSEDSEDIDFITV